MSSNRRKTALLAAVLATCLMPAFFIRLDEPTLQLNLFKVLAKIGSLCGTVLFFWQFLLGFRQAAARWVTPDYLWVVGLHKRLGMLALPLVLLHPAFIIPYYRIKHGQRPLLGVAELPGELGTFVPLGIAAAVLLLVIVATSTVLRAHMARAPWYCIHLGSYVLLPLALVHGYPIGMTIGGTPLRWGWLLLSALTALLFAWRLAARLGVGCASYEVVCTEAVGDETTEIALRPMGSPLRPAAAQFAFFRRKLWASAHPYTISKYDGQTGELSITVKALGEASDNWQDVRSGERFRVDGPYGVFGREAFTTARPIVMLAGGIGVTPFRRMIDELGNMPGREAFLFYGNPTAKDIAHGEEIEDAGHVDVVHVLSNEEPRTEFESGYITPELLRKHLESDLARYEYFLCGPAAMVEKIEPALREAGVPDAQIHCELFKY